MPNLSNPKYKRWAQNDDNPICQFQTANIKEILQERNFYHSDLSEEHYSYNGKQALTSFEMQSTLVCLKCASIEEIEEVGHHKCCEE